ncbi:MAG: amidase family protein, partial [Thermoanaerobaculia bacterium]|nr:amidase family protein [Thermoanaerobaculia bacterium]
APLPDRPFLDEVKTAPGQLRIAVTTEAFNGAPTDPECRAAVESVAQLCRDLGHRVDDAAPTIDADRLGRATGTIVGANILANLEERAEALGRPWTEDDVEPLTWSMARNARDAGSGDYARAIRTVHQVGRTVGRFFEDWDVLLSPTMACLPKPIGVLSLATEARDEYMDHLRETIGYTQLMNVAGNSAMSVPLAWSESGLPIGIQFAARFGDEATLYRLAGQLEEARPWRDRRPDSGGRTP